MHIDKNNVAFPHKLLSRLQPLLRAKPGFQQILSSPEEYLCSFTCTTQPGAPAAIYVKFSLAKELGLSYSARLPTPLTNREQLLGLINKVNSSHKENAFTYCLAPGSQHIESKLCLNSSLFSIFDEKLLGELCRTLVENEKIFQSFVREIFSMLDSKAIVVDKAEQKKKNKSSNYLLKLKAYVEERIFKQRGQSKSQTQDSSNQSPEAGKNILRDQIFIKNFKERVKQLFEQVVCKTGIKIMRKIKVNKLQAAQGEWSPSAHNFGSIERYLAQFEISNGSVHKQTNEHIKDEVFINTEGLLVEKKPEGNEQSMKSFKTELGILMHLRARECCFIGEYFVQQTDQKCQFSRLFSTYYPGEINKKSVQSIKGSKRFNLLSNIAIGLGFLSYCGLIHRDLKPSNVLLDRKKSPRLIDFGSAMPQNGILVKQKIDYELRTTLKYNLIYDQVPEKVKASIERYKFDTHQNFDIYAFGRILEEVFLGDHFKKDLGEYYYQMLEWALSRCKDQDPARRIHPEELAVFLRLLLKQFIESTE